MGGKNISRIITSVAKYNVSNATFTYENFEKNFHAELILLWKEKLNGVFRFIYWKSANWKSLLQMQHSIASIFIILFNFNTTIYNSWIHKYHIFIQMEIASFHSISPICKIYIYDDSANNTIDESGSNEKVLIRPATTKYTDCFCRIFEGCQK